jgi:hypothetical protein
MSVAAEQFVGLENVRLCPRGENLEYDASTEGPSPAHLESIHQKPEKTNMQQISKPIQAIIVRVPQMVHSYGTYSHASLIAITVIKPRIMSPSVQTKPAESGPCKQSHR